MFTCRIEHVKVGLLEPWPLLQLIDSLVNTNEYTYAANETNSQSPSINISCLSFQEYTMLCMLCGRAEDSISILPDDPHLMTPLFWSALIWFFSAIVSCAKWQNLMEYDIYRTQKPTARSMWEVSGMGSKNGIFVYHHQKWSLQAKGRERKSFICWKLHRKGRTTACCFGSLMFSTSQNAVVSVIGIVGNAVFCRKLWKGSKQEDLFVTVNPTAVPTSAPSSPIWKRTP